jgi:hypothetical protein
MLKNITISLVNYDVLLSKNGPEPLGRFIL